MKPELHMDEAPAAPDPRTANQPTVITKAVIDLNPGDVLIGKHGGKSVIEDSSDRSGLLGLMRIETEHGPLYMEMDKEVKVLPNPMYLLD